MDTNDPETMEDAFAARLLRTDIPLANPAVLGRFAQFVEDYVRSMPIVDPATVDFEAWVSSRKSYNEQRKEQIRQAYRDLRGGEPTIEMCRKVSSFGKSESYPCDKHMRMINSRSDHFKAWAGPWISALESIVYQIPEFIKHVPVPERPARVSALKQAGRRYFLTDFTAYESHFNWRFLDVCENVLFRHCLQRWGGVKTLTETNAGINKCSSRVGVKVSITGRRMSGDLWTSLGNGFTNLMLAKFIAHEQGKTLTGFVEGDDGLFATDASLTPALYAQLGFTIKIVELDDPCEGKPDMAFCGLIFGESGQIVRDPRRVFENFGWTTSFINAGPKLMMGLLRSKALSLAYETPDCPIVGVLARKALSVTAGFSPVFVEDGYHAAVPDVEIQPFAPTGETRTLFSKVYGIDVPTQLKVESLISTGRLDAISDILPPHADLDRYANRYVVPG